MKKNRSVKRKFNHKNLSTIILLAVILANLLGIARAEAETDAQKVIFGELRQNPAFSEFKQDLDTMKKPAPAKAKAKPQKVVKAVITAYTSSVEETDSDPFTAASGKKVHDGMIAANWLPFGTKVKIPALYGDKVFVVEDRMNARYGYGRMDIWFPSSRTEARKFGVKRVAVEVYYPQKDVAIAEE